MPGAGTIGALPEIACVTRQARRQYGSWRELDARQVVNAVERIQGIGNHASCDKRGVMRTLLEMRLWCPPLLAGAKDLGL